MQILGAVAELERQLIAARTRAGLKAAMARGARPGNPGVRERRPEAIAKITKASAARHLDQLLATVDDWLPTVRQMRPQHDWATVVAKLNEGGGSWRTERLLRAVKLLVAEHLAEPALLGRAPRKPANRRARDAAAAMRRASPSISLQEIGRQLQAMGIPSARALDRRPIFGTVRRWQGLGAVWSFARSDRASHWAGNGPRCFYSADLCSSFLVTGVEVG